MINEIHKKRRDIYNNFWYLTRIIYILLVGNFLINIIIAINQNSILNIKSITIILNLFNLLCSCVLSISTVIEFLFSNDSDDFIIAVRKGYLTPEESDRFTSIWQEYKTRLSDVDIDKEFTQMMLEINSHQTYPNEKLYKYIMKFRYSFLKALDFRSKLISICNYIMWSFLILNALISVCLYDKNINIDANSKNYLSLILKFINPGLCLFMSYVLIFTSDIKSLKFYLRYVIDINESVIEDNIISEEDGNKNKYHQFYYRICERQQQGCWSERVERCEPRSDDSNLPVCTNRE